MDTVHQALGAKNAHAARGLIGPGENGRQIANPRTSVTHQDDETLGNPAVSSGSTPSKQSSRRMAINSSRVLLSDASKLIGNDGRPIWVTTIAAFPQNISSLPDRLAYLSHAASRRAYLAFLNDCDVAAGSHGI
jgi:hypothetical protein